MDSITFKVDGIDKMIAALGNMSHKIEKEILNEVAASAFKIQSDAKKNAPVNLGNLRNSIYIKAEGNEKKLIYTIGSDVSYAPYMEFGTGGKVSIPNGYAEFAAQFRGKSSNGKLEDMMIALAEWIKKKGIKGGTYSVKTRRRLGGKDKRELEDIRLAYAILFKILKKGINPHPFLIPAFEQEKPKLRSKINEIIQNAKS